mmetsp:Transcript_100728/g.260209  ORF Transcript_100728/g.260209 Transcript_100728/m.260209 type:complete len:311 (+) Transcript_100728:88-1020(+)
MAVPVASAMSERVAPAFFALFMFLLIWDAVHNRLGSSNGKFISFVDTCRSVAQYRRGLPEDSRSELGLSRMFFIMLASFLVKFAGQTIVSLMLGKTPLVLSGPRHMTSFLLGLVLLWLSPGDMVYRTMLHSRAVRLFVGMGGGLYKMRKVIFAVETAASSHRGFGFAFLVAVLSVDGTTLTRKGMLWLEARLASRPLSSPAASKHHLVGRLLPTAGDLSLERLRQDGCRGACEALLQTVLPLGAVTALVWVYAQVEWEAGITDDSFLVLRAGLLTLFIWRAGAFDELANIHMDGLAAAEASTIIKEAKSH